MDIYVDLIRPSTSGSGVCVFVCVGLTERRTESMRTHPQHLCVDVGVFVFLCV